MPHAVRRPPLARAALLACAVLTAAGCASPPERGSIHDAVLEVRFEGIAPDEKRFIEAELEGLGTQVRSNPLTYRLPLDLPPRVTLQQLADAAKPWHDRIRRIQNEAGARIVTNNGGLLVLTYSSSKARSESGAEIRIRPFPTGAELYIDTPLPGLDEHRESAEAPVRIPRGKVFRIRLPFATIMETQYIYFRTRRSGQTRFFYYDLRAEKQHEVTGIRRRSDWEHFQKHHELPRR